MTEQTPSNLNMQTIDACPPIWLDFWTYSSPDSILLSVQSPGIPTTWRGPLVLLLPVIYGGQQTAQHLYKQLAHKETNNEKLKHFFF